MKKVRWGVLGVAKIATEKVIPAMQRGKYSAIVAIASRTGRKANAAARKLGIPTAHGTYESLLEDPEVEAIYNPLPNHLHVPWTIKAIRAGKHVLCEKPIALDAREAKRLYDAASRAGRLVQEAFMVKTMPQWLGVRELVRMGNVGKLRAIQGFFSYFNRDRRNVRNIAGIGGGGILDIGCYPVTMSRFVTGKEPRRVLALVEFDPDFKTDRLASAILDFPDVQATFTCSTQCVPYQRMHFLGTKGRIEVQIPFNAPNRKPCKIFLDDGSDVHGRNIETMAFDTCDQYTIQGDLFSQAIREGARKPPLPLADGVRNMAVLDALFRSGKSGRWEKPRAYDVK